MWMERGRQSQEFEDKPPQLQLDYTFNTPFNAICTAYLKNWNWEQRTQLSTIPFA
jgi:hypothetical protein